MHALGAQEFHQLFPCRDVQPLVAALVTSEGKAAEGRRGDSVYLPVEMDKGLAEKLLQLGGGFPGQLLAQVVERSAEHLGVTMHIQVGEGAQALGGSLARIRIGVLNAGGVVDQHGGGEVAIAPIEQGFDELADLPGRDAPGTG